MLAKANRITRASDYKATVRRGYRVVGPNTVVYLHRKPVGLPVRFGFIVAKSVGNAVVRNRIRRRLKAVGFHLVPTVPEGTDVVIRALPASAEVGWSTLQAEISDAFSKGSAR